MKYLTTSDLAARWNVTTGRIKQWALAGRLKGQKVGRDWLFADTVQRPAKQKPGVKRG